MAAEKTQYQLPDLPYDYADLEPVISAEIMQLHHQKHHQTYVTQLNAALEKYHEAENKKNPEAMLSLQSAIKFNGGGHINHSIFWSILTAPSKAKQKPSGDLLSAIEKDFGSFEKMQEEFTKKTVAIQGSGWGWLGFDLVKKRLVVMTCANQDPLSATGLVPIFGADVWEHAYYLQYKNVRPDYVKALWKIYDWDAIANRFAKALS